MDKLLSNIRDGVIGEFRIVNHKGEPKNHINYGYLEGTSDGLLQLRVVDTGKIFPLPDDEERFPESIIGTTESGQVLLMHPTWRNSTYAGGPSISNSRFRFKTVICGPTGQLARTPTFTAARVFFPGIARWAGLRTYDEKIEQRADGRMYAVSIELFSPQETSIEISRGMRIHLSGHWEYSGGDRKEIYAPVQIGCESDSPSNLTDLLRPLLRIQDLLNIKFNSYVAADGGQVVLSHGSVPDKKPILWTTPLMHGPPGTRLRDANSSPALPLQQIGGLPGIRRWLRLYDTHPRSVKAVVDRFRRGNTSPETRLLETATGLEYWVSSHKRQKVQWAKTSPQSLAVARNVGVPFRDWIGDVKVWSDIFWDAYNGLKHNVRYNPDPIDIHVLAESGQFLLTAALLKRISPDNIAIQSLFESRQAYGIRDEVRTLIRNPPPNIRQPRGR
ncbi:HEPN domain-containing protein [Embleya scabrispora]|uniref:ApeA N-terminal domain 1-containing protein n=1 Tax=Embleya scabrispora TaxID=159449 RepID=UPI00117BF678|nr:HEPN domain-containing protein [Embleya scabrispora]